MGENNNLSNKRINGYFDYAATTPVDPRVLQVMLPFFDERFGNPSSVHRVGQDAEAALEDAREKIAETLRCTPKELIFTSGGTESDNFALRGCALAGRKQGKNHILTSPVEHPAVLHTAEQLRDDYGFDLEFLPVDDCGMVDPREVANRIRPDTALVSVIFANNEVGTINPIHEIGKVCRQKGVPFHTDAVQAAAHLPIHLDNLPIDLMSIGAHKFYGPKGVGCIFIRNGTQIIPSHTGGSHEFGIRAGTPNVPYITGMAEALYFAQKESAQRTERVKYLRDRIIGEVLEGIPDARLTGHPVQRLPNHASFVFRGADGNLLLMLLDQAGYACSSGSACKTGDPEPSDVLLAMGLDREWALGSLRVTLGSGNTPGQVDQFLKVLPDLVEKARMQF